MKTDDLISALASDAMAPGRSPWPAWSRLLVAGCLTAPVVAMVVVDCLPGSPHLRHGLQPTATFSVAAGLLLALVAYRLAAHLSRPEAVNLSMQGLWLAPAVLTLGIVAELVRSPASTWWNAMVGANPLGCFSLVVLLSMPILAGALLALKAAAPPNPGRMGAMAGAFAGGLCSAIYVLHCPENSLLYVAAWHAPAVLTVVMLGALMGRRLLRW